MSDARSPMVGDCVVDASVLVKVVLPEIGSVTATRVVRGGSEGVRAVPDLAYLECANILWKNARRGLITADDARAMLHDLLLLPLRVAPSTVLAEPALALALERGVTAYDASYVALSNRLSIPLLTADEALVRLLGGPSDRLRLLGT